MLSTNGHTVRTTVACVAPLRPCSLAGLQQQLSPTHRLLQLLPKINKQKRKEKKTTTKNESWSESKGMSEK